VGEMVSSAGDWENVLIGEPGWLPLGTEDGPQREGEVRGRGELRDPITSTACRRARLVGVWWGAVCARDDEGRAGVGRWTVRRLSGSRGLAGGAALRRGDVGRRVEWFGRVGLGALSNVHIFT
jgi:hypothetical protein